MVRQFYFIVAIGTAGFLWSGWRHAQPFGWRVLGMGRGIGCVVEVVSLKIPNIALGKSNIMVMHHWRPFRPDHVQFRRMSNFQWGFAVLHQARHIFVNLAHSIQAVHEDMFGDLDCQFGTPICLLVVCRWDPGLYVPGCYECEDVMRCEGRVPISWDPFWHSIYAKPFTEAMYQGSAIISVLSGLRHSNPSSVSLSADEEMTTSKVEIVSD